MTDEDRIVAEQSLADIRAALEYALACEHGIHAFGDTWLQRDIRKAVGALKQAEQDASRYLEP